MIRGVRGATTVNSNDAKEILTNTKLLVEDIIKTNEINPDDVASVLISVTPDINATFPAKPIRELEGWTYVPVMCMQEIAVPGSLEKCIRVMMTINTSKSQPEINHVYHYNAKKLRPDLVK
ncbi:chorismate mutase AroH [Paraliobacillus quinghaiensis]|uniref:chorismate mutase n=1 Tax=Paraliobacillus quinghaiensis TaxID=470815 RepID=A0A917TGY1_9BACI|nr:chorismate mutase [Paraliobacillus quinghaiensis]GGM22879.1 chorismate mutase AroH [Paraliobacillus quinghaiensis]